MARSKTGEDLNLVASPLLISIGIRDQQALGWIKVKAPVLLAIAMQPLRDSKAEAAAEQQARVQRVGRDPLGVVDLADYGHSIRQVAVLDHRGVTLRGPDVELSEAADVSAPNRCVRRARRSDPLLTLERTGCISSLQLEAAERLRDDIERSAASMPAGTMPAARTPPWDRTGVSEAQVGAMAAVRDAIAEVDENDRLALLWMLAGGSVAGFSRIARQHHQTVTNSLRTALAALVRHYRLHRWRET
jgi:hypothetical protein